jgi:hypothetical protein
MNQRNKINNMKKGMWLIALIFTCCRTNYVEKNTNLVPNQEAAIRIAEEKWLSLFGKEIYKKRPFSAILIDDTLWSVTSTQQKSTITNNGGESKTYHFFHGGLLYITIKRRNGDIVDVGQYK